MSVILAAEFSLVAALWGIVTFSNIHIEWPFGLNSTQRPAVVEEQEAPSYAAAGETDEQEETAAYE